MPQWMFLLRHGVIPFLVYAFTGTTSTPARASRNSKEDTQEAEWTNLGTGTNFTTGSTGSSLGVLEQDCSRKE
jgi:hypothetical protein